MSAMDVRLDGPAPGDGAPGPENGTELEKQSGRNGDRSVRQGNEIHVPVHVTPRRSKRRRLARSFGEVAGQGRK